MNKIAPDEDLQTANEELMLTLTRIYELVF